MFFSIMVYPRRVNVFIVPCSIQYCLSIPIDCIIKHCNSLHLLTPDSQVHPFISPSPLAITSLFFMPIILFLFHVVV